MTIRRTAPRVVIQISPESCWAAALESWLDAVGDPARKRTQKELLKPLPENDLGLKITPFRNVAASLGMDTKMVSPADFRADNLETLLKTKSVLFVGFEVQEQRTYGRPPWWHDVVVYGVTIKPRDEPTYDVMDPAQGHRTFRKSNFFPTADEPLLLGWKAIGRPGQLL